MDELELEEDLALGEEAAGVDDDPTLPPPEEKTCKICEMAKALKDFPWDHKTQKPKGSLCLVCSSASESLQRLLRTAWGKSHYKTRYDVLKKRPEVLQPVICSMGKDPGTKTRRSLRSAVDELSREEVFAHRTLTSRRT
eukprot:3321434-Amphidinium_carterae.1